MYGVHTLTIAGDGSLAGQRMSLPGSGRAQSESWQFLRPLGK
jgi:hypothetical protein